MIITICIINFILTTVFLLLSLYHHDLDYLYHNYHQYGTIIYIYYHFCHYQFPFIIIINAGDFPSIIFNILSVNNDKDKLYVIITTIYIYFFFIIINATTVTIIYSVVFKSVIFIFIIIFIFQLPDSLFLVSFLINLFILPSIYYLSKLPPPQPPIKTPITITLKPQSS